MIALVVTIIVLLILAAVAINLTVGENGIIRRAKESVDIYNEKANEEKSILDDIDKEIGYINGENKTRWVKIFVDGLLPDGIVSVNNREEIGILSLDEYDNNFINLYGHDIEILSDWCLFSNTDKNYYRYNLKYGSVNQIEKTEDISNIVIDNNNFELILTKDNQIRTSYFNGFYFEDYNFGNILPELEALKLKKWKSMEKIDINEYDSISVLLTSMENERYVIRGSNLVNSRIYNIDELFPSLSGIEIEKIININSDSIDILTKDGKYIIISEGSQYVMPFEKKIKDVSDFIIETVDGEYFIPDIEEQKFKRLDEIYPELKDIEKICDYNLILTKTGKVYTWRDEGLVNITASIESLIEGRIKDIKVTLDGETIILTTSGIAYILKSENEIEEIAYDVEKIEDIGNICVFINMDGQEGIMTNENEVYKVTYPSNGGEVIIQNSIGNIEKIINGKILTEEGELYQIDENNYNLTKLTNQDFNGNKIIYLSDYYIIDELHNIYVENRNGIENITNSYPELNGKEVEQLVGGGAETGLDLLTISKEGKLEAYVYNEESEECIEIMGDTKFIKVDSTFAKIYALDALGNAYVLNRDGENNEINIKKINDLINNQKIIDITRNLVLTENGKIYGYNEFQNKIEENIVGNNDIVQMSLARNSYGNNYSEYMIGYINKDGKRFLEIIDLGSMVIPSQR